MSDQGETQSVSIKDRIGAMLASQEQPAQPEAPQEEVVVEEQQQQVADQPEETPQAEAPEATPNDWVEIEMEGEKLQVPPKWQKAFMQERDYTQKRQADADRARIVEAREQHLQLREQAIQHLQPLYGKADSLNATIQQYERLDWETLKTNDPVDFSAKRADYAALLQQRSDLARTIEQGHGYLNQMSQQALAAQAKAAEPLIRKAVPDWGPEKDAKLTKLAIDKGATPYELVNFVATRPWAIELMDAASKWYELQASKAQLPKKTQMSSPVAKPGAKPTHVSADAALYRKNIESFRQSGGKDPKALRALIKAKLGT